VATKVRIGFAEGKAQINDCEMCKRRFLWSEITGG
jgi:hypothetical protein